MRAILPGQPNARCQTLATSYWASSHITVGLSQPLQTTDRWTLLTRPSPSQVYLTGNAFTVLTGPQTVVQTVYADSEDALEAVDIDEESGRIATCTRTQIAVYKPCDEDSRSSLQVRTHLYMASMKH